MVPDQPSWWVLLVDDDEDLLSTMRDVLALEGIPEVRCARSAAEAQQELTTGTLPAVVVLDLALGDERGEAFAARLRSAPATRSVPIVALSAHPVALARAGSDFSSKFLKPAEPRILVDAIRALARALRSAIPWSLLLGRVRSAYGGASRPRIARDALRRFREYGQRPTHGWLPCGLVHEQPSRPSTWGPRSPAEVDWTGF